MKYNDSASLWLWIEPYVHIFIIKNHALLYNSFSGAKLEYDHPGVIRILKKLRMDENLRVIELKPGDMKNPAIIRFVEDIKNLFMGDTSAVALSKGKPVQLIPLPRVQSDMKRMKRDPYKVGKSIMMFLSGLTIYINNRSSGNLDVHSKFSTGLNLYKQFLFPYVGEIGGGVEIPVKEIEKILTELKESGLCVLNITGGNIFDHSEFDALLKFLDGVPVKKVYHVHYLDLVDCLQKARAIAESDSYIALSVTFPVIEDKFETAVRFAGSRPGVSFTFAIANETDLETCEGLISRYNIDNVHLKPYFNSENLNFFESMVFIRMENIREANPSQKEIFKRMEMNPNDFGKLTIMIDGSIYANVNAPKIGSIKNSSIRDAIHKELFRGKSWMKTRPKVKPCNGCLYNILCPSISNYEYVLGRYNLCILQKKINQIKEE